MWIVLSCVISNNMNNFNLKKKNKNTNEVKYLTMMIFGNFFLLRQIHVKNTTQKK